MVLQTEFIASIDLEIKDEVKYLYDGVKGERKIKCSVPHDLGDPCELLIFEYLSLTKY